MPDNDSSSSCIDKSQPKNTHISLNMTILADLNCKSIALVNNLMHDAMMHTYICHDVITIAKCLQFIKTSLLISHLFIHQLANDKAMNDKRTHYTTMVKS